MIPLDEIDLDDPEQDALEAIRQCDEALNWLQQGHDQRLQGLRVFCEHRDPRSVPLLLPLLEEVCPVVRMSAVYALGRNPSPPCCRDPSLKLLQEDSNAYVRKATAWSLGNYPRCTGAESLDSRLADRCGGGALVGFGVPLAEAGVTSAAKADPAAGQLLISLRIDSESVVRSNCIWALGRLLEHLVEPRRLEVIEVFVRALLHDRERSVRDEARTALEQMESPDVLDRLQTLMDEGLFS